MAREQPFLGTTKNIDEAFPGIDDFTITVEQDHSGYYCQHDWQRKNTYTKADRHRYVGCKNPRCQQGGLDLQDLVLFHGAGERSISCGGHEGSPKGRRKGDPCDNYFKAMVTITLQQNT